MDQTPLTPGIYQHYKGPKYELIGTAIHTESREWMAVYKALYPIPKLPEGTLFVRPMSMFTASVEYKGATVPRFKLLDE
jgi:hypothetical protein